MTVRAGPGRLYWSPDGQSWAYLGTTAGHPAGIPPLCAECSHWPHLETCPAQDYDDPLRSAPSREEAPGG
jgi:hypothetical protein